MYEEIFRTFLKGKGKKSAEKHQGIKNIRTYDDASQFDNYGGILNTGFVDISFDSAEQSDTFMKLRESEGWKCLVLENPSNHHIHTYWKDSTRRIKKKGYTDARLAVGLIADIHSGETYIPLCVDGVTRTPIADKDAKESYDEVPDELVPVTTNAKLWDMREGDGRDSALFGYEITLSSQVTSDEVALKRIISNINSFVFAEPLSDEDIERITRQEAMPQATGKGGFVFSEFGNRMIRDYSIKKINKQLHIYHDGIYISDVDYIEHAMLQISNTVNTAKRKEVMNYLKATILDNTPTWYFDDYIAFQNGVLDLTDGTMKPFSPAYIILNKIPWNYDPTAYDEATDEMLDRITCRNKDIRALLEEMTGYCFYRSDKYRKSFILTGKGKNGKSTFLKMLRFALDKYSDNNVSSLSLQDLGDRFSTVQLYEKLANIGDDIPNSEFSGFGLSIFKKVVSGETMKVEYKGKDAFNMKPYAKQIFAANRIPNFKAPDLVAIRDRLIIIPFNARFDKSECKEFNPNIMTDLMKQPAIEYLIRLGVEGLKRVIDNQGFTEADASEKELDEFELDNDSILSWIDSLKSSDDESLHDTVDTWIVGRPFNEIYNKYHGYCVHEGMEGIAGRNFSKELCNRVDGLIKSRLKDDKRSITYEWHLTR